jgi:DNA-binding transcriptional ArsR family regulator
MMVVRATRRRTRRRVPPALDVFVALADPTRRSLLDLLREGDKTVNALAGEFSVTRPAISQHLRVLRHHGLVAEQKVGRQRFYSLRAAALREAGEWIAAYEAFWGQRLDRLRAHLDRGKRS